MKIKNKMAVAIAVICTGFFALALPEAPSATETETVHYVTLKFTQSSFTLSISQRIKDAANTFYVTLPTTKRFYDSVKEGDLLNSKFKAATFLLNGNLGSRKVYIHKKFTKQENQK